MQKVRKNRLGKRLMESTSCRVRTVTRLISLEKAGFCGDYCGKCPNYPQKCRGCVASDHTDCHFVKCCSGRGIEHCGFCPEFPCKKLSDFCPDDRPECPVGYHIENLRVRRVVGTEAWLKSQQEIWKT